MDEKNIIDYFLLKNPISKGKNEKPYLILFDGISGTGKSTIAKILSEKLNTLVFSNDKVRQYLYKTDYIKNSLSPRLISEKLLKEIQYHRIKEAILKGNNCILDANVANNFEEYLKFLKDNNIKFFIIKLKYNRKKVIKRISKRTFDSANFSASGSETLNYSEANANSFFYMEKRNNKVTSEYIYFTINTSKGFLQIEKQISELIKKINN